jgi:hypothetical protein
LYRHDKTNEPTKEGFLSFVLFESPFTQVSTVSRGHPSLVSLVISLGWTTCKGQLGVAAAGQGVKRQPDTETNNCNKRETRENLGKETGDCSCPSWHVPGQESGPSSSLEKNLKGSSAWEKFPVPCMRSVKNYALLILNKNFMGRAFLYVRYRFI